MGADPGDMEFDFMCKKYVMYEDNDAVKMTLVLCSFSSSSQEVKLKNNCFHSINTSAIFPSDISCRSQR